MAAGNDTPHDDEAQDDEAEDDEAQDDAAQDEAQDDAAQDDEAEAEDVDEAEDDEAEDEDEEQGRTNISGTTAPSIGPHTTIEHEDPEERLARHEQSTVDAMGNEKRREVVGGSYGASFAKQATLYGGVLAIVAALVIGFIILAGQLDKSPETYADEAPWSEAKAEQTPVEPLE